MRVDVLETPATLRIVHCHLVAQVVEQAADFTNQETRRVGERTRIRVPTPRLFNSQVTTETSVGPDFQSTTKTSASNQSGPRLRPSSLRVRLRVE